MLPVLGLQQLSVGHASSPLHEVEDAGVGAHVLRELVPVPAGQVADELAVLQRRADGPPGPGVQHKTEIAEADVAELLQLFDSVEAKQYKRPDMNGDLRLGFASDDFAGTKWKNLTGTRWSDGTEMVTLDYSHLTSVLWGVCKGFQARLDALEAWQAQRGPKNK